MARADASPEAVLIVSPPGSYRLYAYVQAAETLGLSPRVVSSATHPLTGIIEAGISVPLDDPPAAVAEVLADPLASSVRAVVGTDDATVELAGSICAGLGLSHNPIDAINAAARKDVARRRLREAGCAVPAHKLVDSGRPLAPQLAGLSFPIVIKPLALSGSRGVIRADDLAGARAAVERSAAIVREAEGLSSAPCLLAEQYVHGPEVAVEAMLSNGKLSVLAVFDKPDPLVGPYFEETLYVTPSRHPQAVLAEIERELDRCCKAYGLEQGPVHAEFRLGSGGPWVLEVAARTIGGDCARLFKFGTGRSLEELVLLNALGRADSAPAMQRSVGVLMLPTPQAGVLRRVEGVLAARAIPGVEDVVIAVREGYELRPLPEGSSYLGFVFASGDEPAQVEAALRAAHQALKVVVGPMWKVELR